MAHVIRIKGSPDRWVAHSPTGWVNEAGDTVELRVMSSGMFEEFKGAVGDKKVELLGGFGGKVVVESVSVKELPKEPTKKFAPKSD